VFSETQKPRRIKKRAEVVTPQPLLNNPRLATELAPLSLEEVFESLAFTLLLTAALGALLPPNHVLEIGHRDTVLVVAEQLG